MFKSVLALCSFLNVSLVSSFIRLVMSDRQSCTAGQCRVMQMGERYRFCHAAPRVIEGLCDPVPTEG